MSKVSEYRKTTATFQYYNPNPLENEKKAWDRGDCVWKSENPDAELEKEDEE